MDGWIGDLITWVGAFFVFGTFWFFVVGAAVFSWLVFLTEKESNFLASIILLGFIWIVTSVNGFSIINDPVTALKWAGVYLAAGVLWSFVKWFTFLFSKRDELRAHKESYIKRFAPALQADGTFSPEDLDDFIKYLNDQRYTPNKSEMKFTRASGPNELIPAVSDNVKDLTRWVAWWPFSVTWTMLNDALRKLVRGVVRVCEGMYQRMSLSMFKKEF